MFVSSGSAAAVTLNERFAERVRTYECALQEGETLVVTALLVGGERLTVYSLRFDDSGLAEVAGWDEEGHEVEVWTPSQWLQIFFCVQKSSAEPPKPIGFRLDALR